jgi:hypothetical protein
MSHTVASSTREGPRLVIYPGERIDKVLDYGVMKSVVMGSIYVLQDRKVLARYEVAGGLPPGRERKEAGGHTAGSTPAGHYTLGRAEHHVTANWPLSTIPWGARIRKNGSVIEFQQAGTWIPATGPDGRMTRAQQLWRARSRKPVSLATASAEAETAFYNASRELITVWHRNDFGKWSWNLLRDGHRTAYYIHTTPEDEAFTSTGTPFHLMNSHGCLHVRPRQRDEMVSKGYLAAGIVVEVTRYGLIGPPKHPARPLPSAGGPAVW